MDSPLLDWLNYHHLLYFWTVAREGSIAKACERLHLAQPTVSNQLQKLERSLGAKLFERQGRKLQMTETGRLVYRYSEEIFALGNELRDAVRARPTGKPLRFTVGVPDALPKLIVYRLLRPAFEMPEPIMLVCREGRFDELLADLATHELDLVLSDVPAPPSVRVRAYSHSLGQCGVGLFGTDELANQYRGGFPQSLNGAPLLMPSPQTSIRRQVDHWFETLDLRPRVVAELADSALLKVFGQEGRGLFPAPMAIAAEVKRQYGVTVAGVIPDLQERYYAVSVERRLKHPAVVAISAAARNIFAR